MVVTQVSGRDVERITSYIITFLRIHIYASQDGEALSTKQMAQGCNKIVTWHPSKDCVM